VVAHASVDLSNRLHDQCAFETQLARKLRMSGLGERLQLYGAVYDEYVERFPESLPVDNEHVTHVTRFEKAFLSRFLTRFTVMAEVGPGRCHLAFAVAPLVRKIYGVDVASVTAIQAGRPVNFELKLTDGIRMPFDDASIDLVYSNQLMEHLHPDDAAAQLHEIYRVLRPGGCYICVTPSRINGPHDSSAYFDDLPCPVENGLYVATGLHLKEYTTSELQTLFSTVGFKRVQTWIGAHGHYFELPPAMMTAIETLVRLVPPRWRKRSRFLGIILGNRICASK
jgi:ubiquinone/menaquinone biosynthesis C-methylase UbiE